MNVFELLFFLAATSIIGAIAGAVVGVFTVGLARGAVLGAFAGPVVAACGLTLFLLISGIRKSLSHKATSKDGKKT